MSLSFQIIQNHSSQSLPTILIQTQNTKYFFNVPETFQRFMASHRLKFAKESKIFLTRLHPLSITGLFGVLLTSYSFNVCEGVKIYGPRGLSQYLDSIRFIMGFKILPFSCFNFGDVKGEEERLIGVKDINQINQIVERKDYKNIFFNFKNYLAKYPEFKTNDAMSLVDKTGGFYKDDNLSIIPIVVTVQKTPSSSPEQFITYILITPKPARKFLSDKLKAYQIFGPTVKKLLSQGLIQLPDGRIVTLDMVQMPEQPSAALIIVDCPNNKVFEALSINEELAKLMKEQINLKDVSLKAMIHLLSPEMVENKEYSTFANKFDCEHVFGRKDLKEQGQEEDEAIHDHTILNKFLNKYFPDLFPDLDITSYNPLLNILKKEINQVFPNLTRKSLFKFLNLFNVLPHDKEGFFPIKGDFKKSSLVGLTENFKETPLFIQKYVQFLNAKNNFANKLTNKSSYVEAIPKNLTVHMLGTGSMIPAQYRNVSGIFLDFLDFSILLDCGEGSYLQMLHCFGADIGSKISKLKIIFISHAHVDHHAGLFQLIYERNKEIKRLQNEKNKNKKDTQMDIEYDSSINENPLFLVLPWNLAPWYHKFNEHVMVLEGVEVVYHQQLSFEKPDSNKFTSFSKEEADSEKSPELGELEHYEDPELSSYLERDLTTTSLQKFKTFLSANFLLFKPVPVQHCPQSHALVITLLSPLLNPNPNYIAPTNPKPNLEINNNNFEMKPNPNPSFELNPNSNLELTSNLNPNPNVELNSNTTASLTLELKPNPLSFKVVYSGDTRPTKMLIKEGEGAGLLIHEATFRDELAKNAEMNMHCTIKEAVDVAREMKCWRVILTHFSQRYNSMPIKEKDLVRIKEKDEEYFDYLVNNCVFAFDLMRIKVEDLEYLPKMNEAVVQMLPLEEEEEGDVQGIEENNSLL